MIIQWLRRILKMGEHSYSDFEIKHFAAFEAAIAETDVVAYTYDNKYKGGTVVLKGSELHPVNAGNLVSFYRLNRQERRKLDAHILPSGHVIAGEREVEILTSKQG